MKLICLPYKVSYPVGWSVSEEELQNVAELSGALDCPNDYLSICPKGV